jgi:hypothetical protein
MNLILNLTYLILSHPNLSFHFPGLRTAMNSLKSYNYPDKNFDEGLKDLRVDDQLNLIRISGGDVGHRPGRLLHDV